MKISNNLLHLSLKEAFLDIVPFYIISSLGILFINVFNIDANTNNIVIKSFLHISNTFSYLFPIFLIIAISYYLANNYHISRFISICISLLVFIKFAWVIENNQLYYNHHMEIYAFFIPIISTYLYIYLYKIKSLKIIKENYIISNQLKIVVNSLIPILIVYLFLTFLIPYISEFLQIILEKFFLSITENFSIEIKTFIQVITTHIIWWLTGIHGTHIYNIFADLSYSQQEIFQNLTSETFIYSFLVFGGAGSTLSLIIAIILKSKNHHNRKISFISFPFAIFNINEILLFGLPIIMNFTLLIPFLLLPIINFFTSYLVFSFFAIPESDYILSWTTPIFVSGYLLGNAQSYIFVFLQLFNLIVGVFVYLPFLKLYDQSQELNNNTKKLKEKFNIKDQVDIIEEISFFKTQAEIIKEKSNTHKMVEDLISGDLLLYYQPKIDIKNDQCYGFEALLRFKTKDNKIVGPYFISQIEKAGYNFVIDLWVINQVLQDLEKWHKKSFFPRISINLSPESISNEYIINKIIRKLKNKNVEIEILERTFASEHCKFMKNILKLKANGFAISIDDFGTGFSSLQYLHILPANIIKLDKTLLDNITTSKGKILYKDIAKMCQHLNYTLISEGVETKEDVDFLKSIKIDIIQGFYYSKAIPFNEVYFF
ncbi:diguanylate phosphodiesterase (CelB domain) [Malaciobacter mytili LMG 24559]|nr:EAL domain-containing protein [Malaciobacter mytili]AXH15394.1 diguanylate phosphodiesterase (CelB domain) [Malaciobacter mytili LMG 24559]